MIYMIVLFKAPLFSNDSPYFPLLIPVILIYAEPTVHLLSEYARSNYHWTFIKQLSINQSIKMITINTFVLTPLAI